MAFSPVALPPRNPRPEPSAGEGVLAAADRLCAVRLEDVYGRTVSLAASGGSPLVLVYAGRRGADAAIRVGRALEARYRGSDIRSRPRIVPVACLGEVPRFFRGLARSRIRDAAKGLKILIDFERGLEQEIGMQPDRANIAVLNGDGSLRGVVTGGDESCVSQVELMIGTISD